MPERVIGPADPAGALADLRSARRRNRVAQIHWIDALYQVYVTAFFSIIAVLLVSGWLAGDRLGPWRTFLVSREGPDVIGIGVAAAILVGLRSGARGGPVAVEAADARHVLLAPIDRALALRGPVLRQLRFGAFAAVVVGALGGQFAARRLTGGSPVAWVACGALATLVILGLGYGAALLAGGHRLPIRIANLVGVVLLAWAVGDVVDVVHWSPTGLVGAIPFWPVEWVPEALATVAVAVVAVLVGLRGIGGIPLEAAERRTRLVGQLRFAATMQDLRTVLVLRRQLALELPRTRPWIRSRGPGRFPVWHRGVRGLLRWPFARLVRLAALGLAAGAALHMVADGTGVMVIPAGLLLYVAALDAVEAMAQEADHPGRSDGVPRPIGDLLVRHLAIGVVAMVVVGALGGAMALALDPERSVLAVAGIAVLPAALAAVAGAALSVLQGIQEPSEAWDLAPPEVQGTRTLARVGGPPLIAVIGVLPTFLAVRAAERGTSDPFGAAAAGSLVAVAVALFAFGWVHQRESIKAWFRQAQEQAGMSSPRRDGDDRPTPTATRARAATAPRKPAPTKVTTTLPRKR